MKDRKRLGAYYTPKEIADALAEWAIRDSKDLVMDPSFGGGAMLRAAKRKLLQLGCSIPEEQIFGADIDPKAQFLIDDLKITDAKSRRFITADFFRVEVTAFPPAGFDVILGNPPYIAHQRLSKDQTIAAHSRLLEHGIKLSGQASYWAPFLLHSMYFLKTGGRLGMVLPGALIHSNYGSQVVEALESYFSIIQVILIQERLFEGTDEESLLLLAEGAKSIFKNIRVASINEPSQLDGAFPRILQQAREVDKADLDGGWLRGYVDEEALRIYDEAVNNEGTFRLGDKVTVSIGVVTGNNRFFTMTQQQVAKWKIPHEFMVPIVRSAKDLNCIQYLPSDKELAIKSDTRGHLLLVIPKDNDLLPKAVRDYLAYGEANKVNEATKCRDRKPWYSIPSVYTPAAFMPCMTSKSHKLIVNVTEATCANNIFRLDLLEESEDITMNAIAMGVLSTLTGLSAELVGRSYGGGVLKLEPSEMRRLLIPRIPIREVEKNYARLDGFLRSGKSDRAKDIVDEIVSRKLNIGSNEISILKKALISLRSRRYNRNKTVGN